MKLISESSISLLGGNNLCNITIFLNFSRNVRNNFVIQKSPLKLSKFISNFLAASPFKNMCFSCYAYLKWPWHTWIRRKLGLWCIDNADCQIMSFLLPDSKKMIQWFDCFSSSYFLIDNIKDYLRRSSRLCSHFQPCT